MHTWFSITPSEGDDNTVGMQVLLHADTYDALDEAFRAILTPFGVGVPFLEHARVNQELTVQHLDPDRDDPDAKVGLVVHTFPAGADGHNLDVDPIEPRAE